MKLGRAIVQGGSSSPPSPSGLPFPAFAPQRATPLCMPPGKSLCRRPVQHCANVLVPPHLSKLGRMTGCASFSKITDSAKSRGSAMTNAQVYLSERRVTGPFGQRAGPSGAWPCMEVPSSRPAAPWHAHCCHRLWLPCQQHLHQMQSLIKATAYTLESTPGMLLMHLQLE